MASLEEVNHLAQAACDFRWQSFDGSRLLIIGSFDLSYYHDIELSFVDVSFVHCPTNFSYPRIEDAGCGPKGHRYVIHTDDGEFEIIAETLEATIGKVLHYDAADQPFPGKSTPDLASRS